MPPGVTAARPGAGVVAGVLGGVAAVVALAGCTWPAASPSDAPPPERLAAAWVSDGDTLTARDADGARVRLRLLGIDAPEAARDGAPAECGADRATAELRRLVTGRALTVIGDPVADPVDRFGRRLVYVTADGRDVALELLEAGLAAAWHPASEPAPSRFGSYAAAEHAARAAGAGLWADCEGVGR